ncbi:sensor histidine kinase [Nakamurella silvestris]|nr:sensor histidine kinase [Nakamurella silvestris]
MIKDGVIERAGILTGPQVCQEPSEATLTALLALAPADKPVNLTVDGYGDYRVLATSLPNGVVAITGLPLSPVRDTQLRLGVIMLIVTVVALLLAAALVYFVVRRNLRPLDRVAATARKVATVPLHEGEVDLGIRVPDRDTDPRTEVGQVGSALNQLLGHVSNALTARQASEMQVRQFVADASHELRTPLASIRGYAELAQRDQVDTATVTHALRRVESESQRMTSLVDDLLLLARLDAGRPLSDDPVDLTMLMIDVVSDAQVAGPDHHWQMELPEEPVEVRGDEPRLHQVLANLLSNARTHTPPGTTVRAGLSTSGGTVVLTVSDDGPGIEEHLQTGIFDRFVRGDSSRSRHAGSTGLGLAIVKAVATAHGGSVSVRSAPGSTVFTVRLPAAN